MAVIIDRRLSKRTDSNTNKQKFKERHQRTIERLVKERLSKGKIEDILKDMDGMNIPLDDREPSVNADQDNFDRVFSGNPRYRKGDTMPKPPSGEGQGSKGSKDGEGNDNFKYYMTAKELEEVLFKHLKLPYLTERLLKELSETQMQNAGYQNTGIPSNLSVVRSFKNAIGRQAAMEEAIDNEIEELEKEARTNKIMSTEAYQANVAKRVELKEFKGAIPFLDDVDLRYRYREKKLIKTSKAVMMCVMDTSGSMDRQRKDIAKNFFVLLALFLKYKYKTLEIVFIAHDINASVVTEKEFFYSTKTGGTMISSGLKVVRDLIRDKYPISQYNIYMAQASDGENFYHDDQDAIELLDKAIMPNLNMLAFIGTKLSDELYRTITGQAHQNSPEARGYAAHLFKSTVKETTNKTRIAFIDKEASVFDGFCTLFKDRGEKK